MSVEPKLGNQPDCKSYVNCKLKFKIFEFNIRKIFSHSHRAGILHRESQKLNESQKCVSKSDGINKKIYKIDALRWNNISYLIFEYLKI